MKKLTGLLLALVIAVPVPQVYAAMIATPSPERERVLSLVQRPEVAQQLEKFGIAPEQAKERVNAMSEAESRASRQARSAAGGRGHQQPGPAAHRHRHPAGGGAGDRALGGQLHLPSAARFYAASSTGSLRSFTVRSLTGRRQTRRAYSSTLRARAASSPLPSLAWSCASSRLPSP